MLLLTRPAFAMEARSRESDHLLSRGHLSQCLKKQQVPSGDLVRLNARDLIRHSRISAASCYPAAVRRKCREYWECMLDPM